MESAVIEQNNDDGVLSVTVSHYTPLQPLNISQDAREAFLRAHEDHPISVTPISLDHEAFAIAHAEAHEARSRS